MKKPQTMSAHAQDAVAILGNMIRAARMQRGMTAAELAVRANVSRGVIQRIEAGETGTSIGAAFETAVVLGIPLFDVSPQSLGTLQTQTRHINTLLAQRAFQASQGKPDNDF
jgi:transcriptional regulator with XRE-family HTH domain